MNDTKKIKTLAATVDMPAMTVELSAGRAIGEHVELSVYAYGELVGYITSFTARTTRDIPGTRLITRGKPFKAWAQRSVERGSFDYHRQHRSQAEAIRTLIKEVAR